ncbi:MAG: hypothetical protein ACM31O_03855 [Bacteroidota bacterium]
MNNRNKCIARANQTANELSDGAVEPMLTISTAHLTPATARALEHRRGEIALTIFDKGDYGWLIHIDTSEPIATSVPADLAALLGYARGLGCVWLCLDRDAATHPEIATFDW